MKPTRVILLLTCIAAVGVFAVVQDRITAAGARAYVAAQRVAMAGAGAPVTIDGIMQPAIARSVQQGLLGAAVVFAAGAAGVAALRARDRRAAGGDPRE